MTFNESLQLSEDQYIKAATPKNLIVIHHTVGATARSTFNHWQENPDRVATAFIVDRDGAVFQVFDPKCWAYHLGVKGNGGAADKRSIGIELDSEGGLKYVDGKYYYFDRITDRTEYRGAVYDHGSPWRGAYRYFAAYTPEQTNSLVKLIDQLCTDFKVQRLTPADHFTYNPRLIEYQSVIGHNQVRNDKTDPHPGLDWVRLINECQLQCK